MAYWLQVCSVSAVRWQAVGLLAAGLQCVSCKVAGCRPVPGVAYI